MICLFNYTPAATNRCPCCIVATFVTEATHELVINRAMMLYICYL